MSAALTAVKAPEVLRMAVQAAATAATGNTTRVKLLGFADTHAVVSIPTRHEVRVCAEEMLQAHGAESNEPCPLTDAVAGSSPSKSVRLDPHKRRAASDLDDPTKTKKPRCAPPASKKHVLDSRRRADVVFHGGHRNAMRLCDPKTLLYAAYKDVVEGAFRLGGTSDSYDALCLQAEQKAAADHAEARKFYNAALERYCKDSEDCTTDPGGCAGCDQSHALVPDVGDPAVFTFDYWQKRQGTPCADVAHYGKVRQRHGEWVCTECTRHRLRCGLTLDAVKLISALHLALRLVLAELPSLDRDTVAEDLVIAGGDDVVAADDMRIYLFVLSASAPSPDKRFRESRFRALVDACLEVQFDAAMDKFYPAA